MAQHVEINPDNESLLFSLGLKAVRLASTQKTHKTGTVRIPTSTGKDFIAGEGAEDGANWIDEEGNQTPLVDTASIDAAVDEIGKKADEAGAKAEQVRSDLQSEVDSVKSDVSKVEAEAAQLKADAAKLSQTVDANKTALDKSVAAVDAKAQAASDKGDQLGTKITEVTSTVNGQASKLKELSTRIEGVASDNTATTQSVTELKQTVTGLDARVSQNTTTANGAMSKATSVEQTANGIKADLSENYTTTAKSDEKYSTKTELTATADGLKSSISSVKTTAEGAVSKANAAQSTADGISVNLSKNYTPTSEADAKYATQTSLKATADGLTAKITANTSKAQSALDKSTSLEANLNGFKTTVSETYATNTKVDGISVGGTNMLLDTRLMKTTGTTNGKLRQSSFPVVEDINGGTLNARGGAIPKPGIAFGEWAVTDFTLGDQYTLSFYVDSDVSNIVNCYFYGASGYATVLATACSGGTIMKTAGYGDGQTKLTIAAAKKQRVWVTWKINASGDATIPKYVLIRGDNTTVNSNVYVYGVKLEKGSKPTDWSPAPEDLQAAGDYATNSSLQQTASSITARVASVETTANGAMSKATTVQQTADGIKTTLSKDYTSTKDADKKYSTKTELTTEAGKIRAELSETTKTANGAMDKSTTLETTVNGISTKISEQATKLDSTVKTANEAKSTADSNKTTISQVSTTASNALNKATTVESSLNGFKTTVSETYQTKADMSSYSTKSYVDETSKSVALGVVQDYKGADGSGLATKTDISVSKTEITSEVSNTYATKDGVSKEISSKITQNNSSLEVKFSNAGSIEYVTNGSFSENLDGWTVDDGQWVINGGDNALQYYKAVSAGASTLGPRQDPSVLMGTSTRQRLIRRSFDIANYSNASGATLRMSCRLNDGTWSGEYPSVELDSTFDWMHVDMVETIPAGKYIDRVVPVIRATNACTVNVEVRNFSLRDITDSYKSADAVINMTGQGVRVGKNKNGAWTGMSALVGTDGTFDVLDTSSKRLLEVGSSGVKFPKSGDGHQLALGYVTDSTTKTDTLYIGDVVSGQQEGGPKNRLGFTGDEVSLEGGDISINANDNQLSLYGRKGANLLVPDGGNVQVGGQSGTSNTTLTLRGSTVNLSGGLVNVNGRTLNAPVDAKQSQRWDNIQLDVKCVNRVVTVNVLHPLGANAVIGDQSDQCEIGYIKEGYRPSRMIGCHLASYNTTNLFLEINPATGKVACFRMWGNQNTWAYFSASLSYVI
ncbi:hypothetical protein [Bifidobacterium dentium]|uniref:hypothetical protein n=1 Tax=Bifidobacterium dentium TaxID=1689 RepID=UPI0028E36FDF|nr:hypothetical protein [Bifidobacterium dentium]